MGPKFGITAVDGSVFARHQHAKFSVHTVGPVWRGGRHGESNRLARDFRRSLQVAPERQVRNSAFPCVSTSVYGYPVRLAAQVAVEAVRSWVPQHECLKEVLFCFISVDDAEIYKGLLETGVV